MEMKIRTKRTNIQGQNRILPLESTIHTETIIRNQMALKSPAIHTVVKIPFVVLINTKREGRHLNQLRSPSNGYSCTLK